MSTPLAPTLTEGGRLASALAGRRFSAARVAVPVAVLTVAVASSNGGYGPLQWGWTGLVLAWTAVLGLVLRREPRPSRLELGFVAALGALLAWTAAANLWTIAPTATPLEAQRTLVYVAAALAAAAVVRRRAYAGLLVGVWGGVALTSAYALITRLAPQQFGLPPAICGQRLCEPVGYWNGLGVFAAMGAILALGIAARSGSATLRALGAASLVVLAVAAYLTFSRGAWLALAAGIAVALLVDPRRVQLATATLVLAPVPAAAVALASRKHALTVMSIDVPAIASEGRQLALQLVLCLLAAAAVALAWTLASTRLAPPAWVARAWTATLVAAALALVAAALAAWGSPPTLVRKAVDSFKTPAPTTSGNLNDRLFSLSGSGRDAQWRAALHQWRAHPLGGAGPGSYERQWNLERPRGDAKVRDAHSLYLETLGEQGAVGLALLVVALALPLVALVRARSRRLVPVAGGAYVAFCLHAAVDWDWELTGVTLVAVGCASALLVAARPRRPPPLGRRARVACGAGAVALAGFAGLGLLGNVPLDSAASSIRAQRWASAEAAARDAIRFAPWSAQGWRRLGQSFVLRDPARARRDLRRAAAKDPGDWELWFDLALATRGAEQKAALEQALRLNPRSPEVREFVQSADLGYRLRLPAAGR